MNSVMPDVDGHRPVQRVWVGLARLAVLLTACTGNAAAGGGVDP